MMDFIEYSTETIGTLAGVLALFGGITLYLCILGGFWIDCLGKALRCRAIAKSLNKITEESPDDLTHNGH